MRALVTGASGYVGRHVAAALVARGDTVMGLVRRADAEIPEGVQRAVWDGTAEGMTQILLSAKPDVVLHIAAWSGYDHTMTQVDDMLEANVRLGTLLLEAMHAAGCTRLVNTGTYWQHRDGANYDPVCLYAATKQAFEAVIDYGAAARGLCAVTLKLHDVYGRGDTRPKLLNVLSAKAEKGEALELGDGTQMMAPVEIRDVVSAFLHSADMTGGQGFAGHVRAMVAGDDVVSVRELVERANALLPRPATLKWGARPNRVREVRAPLTNPRLPGWEPKITLKQGLKELMP